MIQIVFLLFGSIFSVLDHYGTTFEDNELTILVKCRSTLETYQVPSTTTHIKSGTTLENAFGAHCTVLKNVTFSKDSELQEIGSYSFYKSTITYLNLSCCSKLLRILNNAFQDCISLATLELPDSLTHLGEKALFQNKISFLHIPQNLTEIPYQSIAYCKSLQRIEFHPNCATKNILREAFMSSGLVEITIPKSVIKLESAFIGCQLTKIEIDPENPNYIVYNNAVYTKDYKSLILVANYPGNIFIHPYTKTIANNAMRACRPISLKMHENITTLETWSLSSMNLTEISLPKSVTKIDIDLFAMSGYVKIEINCSITSIPYGTFRYCKKLQRVIIPHGVTIIYSNAFYECTSLQYLFIPGTVQTIASGAFSLMNTTCVIEVEEGAGFKFIGRTQYTGDGKTLSNYFGENDVVLEVAYGTTTIGGSSVQSKSFSSIIFPNTTTKIGSQAFTNLKVYETLNLEYIVSIGEYAFEGANFSSIILGPNLEQISSYTFQGCSNLLRIDIPFSVTHIGIQAFSECKKLATVNFDYVFAKSSLISLSLMDSKLTSIDQMAFKKIAAKSIELPPSLTSIGYKAFGESSIQRVSFHSESSLKTLGSFSFADMGELTDFAFPKKCEVIGESCFANDVKLSEILLSDSVKNISTLAFSGCSKLKSVELGDDSNLENIAGLAFEGCTSLSKFVLSENNKHFSTKDGVLYNREVTRIVVYLPAYPATTYVVPESIIEIGPFAFYAATYLENVTILDGCTKIGFEAFRGCKSLSHIRLPSNISDIASGVFADCVSLGCDSVVFPEGMNLDLLKDSQLQAAAYEHCPSAYFTSGAQTNPINMILIACMNCSADDE